MRRSRGVNISFETDHGRVEADSVPDDWIFALRDRALVERLNGTAAAIEAAATSGVAVIPDDEQAELHAVLNDWLPQLNTDLPQWNSVFQGLSRLRDSLAP